MVIIWDSLLLLLLLLLLRCVMRGSACISKVYFQTR